MTHSKVVFLIAWHFPPYKASSGFNLFKRIKDSRLHFDVVQLKREKEDANLSMFQHARATFERSEITLPDSESRSIENRALFCEKCLELFEKKSRDKHYLYLMSHSHEFASHLAAMHIRKKYPHLRWIASFGDPIGANPYNDTYQFPLLAEDTKAEREVLRDADIVMVTNSYQKAEMAKGMPASVAGRIQVVPHCFEPAMYPATYHTPGPFRFRHIGMLYRYKRTSEPIITAAAQLISQHPEYAGKFVIEFFGSEDRYIREASSGALSGIVNYKGVVSYERSLGMMAEADALLLRDADFSDIGVKNTPFFPGKLADYFGAQTPVIAVTMKTGCVPDLLKKLRMPCLTETETTKLANTMKDAIDGKLKPNYDLMQEYQSKNNAPIVERFFVPNKRPINILFAGHDLKFISPFLKALDADPDYRVLIDQWQGHAKHNESQSLGLLPKADVIFCEWGLGNTEWYSKHKQPGQKLIVRMHRQEEITEYPKRFNLENIDHIITISPFWYEKFQRMFNLPRHRMQMFYNMVDCAALDRPKHNDAAFNLGIVGIVPQMKRLDLALDILDALYGKDKRYRLFIKGRQPQDFPWMKTRTEEMAYYDAQYSRIKNAAWCDNVIFDGFGNDMAQWFEKIGWTLSVSDFESFHLAPAEGMASGSVPVIRNWQGAETIHPDAYIHSSIDHMISYIHQNHAMVGKEELKQYPLQNFDQSIIFDKMEINTYDVLKAAGTKWNFLNFYPGLVGGHCIGVDPYYLTFKANELGHFAQVITAGRSVNDGMSKFIITELVKSMIKAGKNIARSKVNIFDVPLC